jgi:hypothetical protein
MGVFTVDMRNDPGQLAKLCAAMAAENVNVILCAAAIGESGTVVFIADNEAAASGALESGDFAFAEHPSVTVRIANHPGEGAEAFGKLAAAGVNLGLVLPVRVSNDQYYAVLGVDDVDKATAALGGQVVTECRVSDVVSQAGAEFRTS